MEKQTTLNISDSGVCPECGKKYYDWVGYWISNIMIGLDIGYIKPESKEIGVFCLVCYTHFNFNFKDEGLSLEEFGFDDLSS